MNLCFTVATINYIKDSLLVRDSFLKHNPNWRFIILVADIITDKQVIDEIIEYRKKDVEFLFFTEILPDCPNYPIDEVTSAYGGFEIAASLKSFGFKHFFNLGWDKVLYVDSDMKFYDSVSVAWDKMEKYDALLTPHMVNPYPDDGLNQHNNHVMEAGLINSGFVAIKNSPDGNKLVDFWMNCVKNKNNADKRDGKIHDQTWTTWFPYMSDNVLIFKDKGYNVAYWNLHERKISKKNGKYFADDRPLVFFHFSGINKKNPESISKHQNRYKLSDFSKDFKELIYDYIDDINSRSSCVSAKTPRFSSFIPNTDFFIEDSMFNSLLGICRTYGYSHISADIDSDLFIAERVANKNIKVKTSFSFDIAGCFSEDDEAMDFLIRFLSAGVFFSIIDINGDKKNQYLSHFYAQKTNNLGVLFYLSDKSSKALKSNLKFMDRKSIKSVIVSDSYSGSDDDLSSVLEMFDNVITLSEKTFKRIEKLAKDKAVLIHYDSSFKLPSSPTGNGYEFIDDIYKFFSSLNVKCPENEDTFFYFLNTTNNDLYNGLEKKYGNLEKKYGNLEKKYGNLEVAYKRLETSISYKIGRIITSPIAFIVNLFQKH